MFLRKKEFEIFKKELYGNLQTINKSNDDIVQQSEEISKKINSVNDSVLELGKSLHKFEEIFTLREKELDEKFCVFTKSFINEFDEINRNFTQLCDGVNQLMIQSLLDKTEQGLEEIKADLKTIKKAKIKRTCSMCGMEIVTNDKKCPYCNNKLS